MIEDLIQQIIKESKKAGKLDLLETLSEEVNKLRNEANHDAMLARMDQANYNYYFGRKMAFVDVLNILKREFKNEEN